MSLSNEERLNKLYYAINFAYDAIEDRTYVRHFSSWDMQHYKNLKRMVGKLWHAFIGQHSNGGHWIFGSATDGELSQDTMDPWSVAIRNHITGAVAALSVLDQVRREFDPMQALSVEHLLGQTSGGGENLLTTTYNIYQATESMIYAVRRYDDALLQDLSGLDKLISDIQGYCFKIFDSKEEFAKAYVLNQICKILYAGGFVIHNYDTPDQFKTTDPVLHWLFTDNTHHDLTRSMSDQVPLKELCQIHNDLLQARKGFSSDGPYPYKQMTYHRLVAALKLAGRRFHYEHKHKVLFKLLDESALLTPEQRLEVEKLCQSAAEAHKANEKETQTCYSESRNEDFLYDHADWSTEKKTKE